MHGSFMLVTIIGDMKQFSFFHLRMSYSRSPFKNVVVFSLLMYQKNQ